ncbi:MAG: 3-deoxy-D-manno-octulosonic acid transferase [Chlamydiales bacterium]|nr:3-deoxy-D-manno-octulosonic acid transferase [Chlamydiales bacterium]
MGTFLFGLFYDFILFLVLVAMLPKVLWTRSKPLEGIKQRLGMEITAISKGSRKLVWVHAVSLGETKAVTALVERLRVEMNDPIFVISSITETGHAEAKRAFPFAAQHLYLPADFQSVTKNVIQKITPDLVILTETDYWYNFLNQAKLAGAKLVVVNGKLSERSTQRYKMLPWFANRLFGQFDHICVQSTDYLERFKAVGVDSAKLSVTGNLKFDAVQNHLSIDDMATLKARLGVVESDRVLTAGSTHDPEEKLLIDSCRILWAKHPNLKLLLVPRHPERFEEVANLLTKEGISFGRYSAGVALNPDDRVVLIDTTGVLKECYQISELAIVAGSYTERVGGHNLLEPCHYGIPVLFGPHMQSQPELERLVLEAKAGIQVQPDDLPAAIDSLLDSAEKREEIRQAAKRLIEANQGSIQRTLQAIKPFF